MNGATLYYVDAKNVIRVWSVNVDYENRIISTEYGVLNGEMQRHEEFVPSGKAGRTIKEQLYLMMKSKINKQLDRGYVVDLKAADGRPTNVLGFKKPMLAKTFGDVDIDYREAFVQRKYDGNRCIIVNNNDSIIAYSRNGKLIDSISHITDSIQIPRGAAIDGELYCHGEKLQTIVSWIKRKQPDTKRLSYICYDAMMDLPFYRRINFLENSIAGNNVSIAETYVISRESALISYFDKFREEGYEGAIVRHGISPYEDGKRSQSLIKLKGWVDSEFLVVDITESKDDWGILECMLPNGKRFTVSAPGNSYERTRVLNRMEDYIGKYVTIKYAYLTNDGIPFHPVAMNWRS